MDERLRLLGGVGTASASPMINTRKLAKDTEVKRYMNFLTIAQQQLNPDALQPIIDIVSKVAKMVLVLFVEIAKIVAPAMIVVGLIGALIAPGTWRYRFEGMLITGAIILVVTYYLLPTLGWI